MTIEHLGRAVAAWLHARLDVEPVLTLLRRKPVPIHRHSWIYTLGDALVFVFVLQALTGGLLLFYYQPAEAAAHESVRKIMTEVPCGALVRSMHVWGATVMMVFAGLHFLTTVWTRAYRRPRELVWMTGMLMLGVVMASGFSGYLLPWNELSYHATRVGTQIPGKLPLVGPGLVWLLRGGEQIAAQTLTRFFAAHIFLAPVTLGLLLALHVFLSRVRGVSLPIGVAERDVRDRRPFFSEFLLVDCCLGLAILGTIVTLAVLQPASLGVRADPLKPAPDGIKPEWYFLFLYQSLKLLPEGPALALWASVGLLLFALPFLDRDAARGRKNPWLSAVFAVLVAGVAILQLLAALDPRAAPSGELAAPPTESTAHGLVSLVLLWSVIGWLVVHLRRLLRENERWRRLRGSGRAPGESPG